MSGAVEWLFKCINSLSMSLAPSDGILTADLSGGIPALYTYAAAAQEVVLPIGYTILALFLLLGLVDCIKKAESAGGGGTMSVQMTIGLLIRLCVCKALIDNSGLLMNAIFSAMNYITTQVAAVCSLTGTYTGPEIDLGFLDDFFGVAMIVPLILSLIVMLLIAMAWVQSRKMFYLRLIEAYLYFIVAPIPLATLPSEEWGQIGRNFLKSFAAVAIQGTLLYLTLAFAPVALTAMSTIDTSIIGGIGVLLVEALYAALILAALKGIPRIASSICSAM